MEDSLPSSVTNEASGDGVNTDSALCEASEGLKTTVSPTSTFKNPGSNTIISPFAPVVRASTMCSAPYDDTETAENEINTMNLKIRIASSSGAGLRFTSLIY